MWHAESMHRDAMRYGLVRRFWGHLGAMLLLGISLALPDIARAACTTFTPVNASAGAPMAAGSTITIDASSCQGVAGFGIGSVTTPASNGTATVTSHAASRISYAHSGNGSTTDTFAFDDGTGTNNVLVTVHIQAAASPITILPATVPPATVGTPYAGASFSASGGVAPYTYTAPPGTLPNGMTLSSSGSLSGTPTAQGTFAFSVTASDSTAGTPLTGTASYSITVAAPTITVTNTPTPAVINSPYTFALAASGGNGPYTYSLDAGTSLPPGLVLAGNGTISGMPTALGLTSFTVRVTDSSTPTPFFAPANLSINVQNVVPPVAGAVSATVAHGSSNNPITLSLSGGAATSVAVAAQATHGTATASGTTISYTPTASYSGPDSFTYTATNAGGTSAPATVTITVSPATISYAPSSPAAGTVGVAYSQSLAGASGGTAPYTYVITSGSLPPGITLASNGTLSGTASANGTFNFTVRATDSSTGTGPFSATSGPLTLTIAAATLTYAPTNPPTATVGVAYSQSLASVSGGVAPYTYAIASGSLPLGITLASNGTLSGTPSAGGSFSFTVTVTDNSGGSGPVSATSGPLLLTVNAPTITITPPTLPTVSAGVAYNQNLTAAGGSGAYTYAVTAGALPPGVSLSAAGVISGTPTAAGTFPLTITATDSSGGSGPYTGSQPYTLNVTAPSLTLTPAAGALSGTAGAPLNVPFSAGNGTAPYTFDISAGALPNGVTLSPTGTLSGSPTVSGLFTFSVRVTDSTTGTGAPFRRTQNYVLSIAAPTITVLPASLPPPLAGVAYSQTITASSGQPTTFTYAVSAGQVPVGLSLNAATGELSGTPTQAGPYNFTVTATDGGGFTGSQAYSGAVGAPVLSLAPSTVAGTTAGTPYSTTFVASGGNPGYSYQLTGTLPNGLSFSPAGMLSGTPTQAGTFNFSVRASDSTTGTGAPFFIVNNYTLSVSAPTVVVDPTTLPAATGGVAYSQAITASGGNGTYTFSLTSGALPVGMSFSSAGVLSGTPTVAGTFTFTVQATDGNGFTGSRSYSLMVNAPTITLAPTTLPGGSGGVAYGQALTANGGVASYTYSLSAGALPPGIALSSAGSLSGTPTTTGNFNFTVTATDSVGFTGSQAYTFSVAAPTITITPATLPAATGSIAYSQPLSASGGNGGYTYSLTAGTLPPGIALSSAGLVSGTPTTTGSYSFTVRATDGFGFTGSQVYTVTVNAPAIVFVQTTLPGGQVAVAYSQTVSAGGGSGSFTYSVSAGALPPGIALSSAGVLSGTPTAPGSYSFTLTATDSFGFTGSQPFTVAINQPVPVVVNDAATTPANAPASIDVTANDTGPITSIAIAQGPSHGTATVNGLNVAYTPGSNFFGNDSFTYTATGPGGTSAPATVSISVTPLAVPVAAAQSATVLAGQSVTVQAEAGAINGPFTAVTISRAPSSGTAVVQGASIVYSADADASGVVDFEYTLSNPFGASAPARISVTVNPRPVASALTATAIAGREVKVDLTSTARGGPFTAAAVVSVSPADAGNATITASGAGYTLAFTSAATFGGAVRITYTLSNAYATSAPGTVDVMVKPRSDPSRDAEVLGVLEAQAEGARRMAIGQINNFQRRLESLRAGGGSAGFSNGITFSSASSQRRTQQDDLLRKGIGASGEGLSMIEAPAVQGDATPAATPSDGFAFWTGGAVNFGKLKPGASSDGIDFTTSGISLGADRQIGPSLTLGAGLGYGHDASDIGRNGSRSTVDGYSVATYGSFHPEGGFYVDGLLGYQWLKFDARRFITDNGNTAHGSRDGTQWFASFSTGYQHRSDALLLTPYGRLDLARATLDGYREHGDEVYALDYQRQTVNTSTATAGVLAQWLVKRDYGMWTPQLRAEFGHDMQGSSQAFMRYVDLMSGPVYRATLDRQSRNHTLLGAGIGLQTLKGWTLRAEYQNQLDSSSRDNQGIQISVQKTLPP